MSYSDQLQRILFDGLDVRGVITGLEQSYQEILAIHQYPAVIEKILGEMLAAVTLLSSNLKFDGNMILQAKGEGSVSTLMAECNHRNECRAIAQFDDNIPAAANLLEMIGKGSLVLTIEPEKGQRYQSYVPLGKTSLAACLEDYFKLSEQLDTTVLLASDGSKAGGLLVQVLPAVQSGGEDWQRLSLLAKTLTAEELLSLDNETLLYRLFHEEQCRLVPAEKIEFRCQCSRERSEKALKTLGREQVLEIIAEQEKIETDCQFCLSNYCFDAADIELLFRDGSAAPSSGAIH